MEVNKFISWLGNFEHFTLLVRICAIVVFTLILILFYNWLIERFQNALARGIKKEETSKRVITLSRILKSGGFALIIFVSFLVILSELKIDIKPVLTAAGIGGIAIGFGAQSLIKDLISGFFLILENQIRVGDVVKVGNLSGVVEDIRIRVLLLRDLSGNLHIIPHGNISEVTNMTHSFSYYLFDYGIAYKEDIEKVIEVIKQVAEELSQDPNYKDDILEPVEILGLERFEDSAVVIRGRIKTKPIRQWRVGRELNLRVKKRFDELGIEIPFPHRTVYLIETTKNKDQTKEAKE